MKQNQVLYSVKGHTGAHILLDKRECQVTEGNIVAMRMFADVQLVGALSPFSVPADEITPYSIEPFQSTDIINTLAHEAVTIYNLDPLRVQRASVLARDPYKVQPAKRDEHGETITNPSWKTIIVKATGDGWYVVKNSNCQCVDNKNGNTCKHRIAAWMRRESIARPLAQARKTTTQIILQELEA